MTLVTSYGEAVDTTVAVAVRLRDGFTRQPFLVGTTAVRLAGRGWAPFWKTPEATFVFLGLPPGPYTVEVRNPFYRPVDIPVGLPMPAPQYPAFPDVTLADPTLPLDDPGQTPAWAAQRDQATLQPVIAYPFPDGTTLVRGTIVTGGNPLQGATVTPSTGASPYETGADGEFVLFFPSIVGTAETITLHVTHPMHIPVDEAVLVRRGTTAVATIAMA